MNHNLKNPEFIALLAEVPADLFVAVHNLLVEFEFSVGEKLREIEAEIALARRAAGSRTSERGDVPALPYERLGENYKPTKGQFTAYQSAFDWFNRELFNGELPQCVLNFSRKAKTHGFFARNQWGNRVDLSLNGDSAALHEITLNPDGLGRGPEQVFSTLVHEMCHLQRFVTGEPSRPGYHDDLWAKMMLAVGLQPLSLDKPGKMTGQKVTHEIIQNGPYQRAFIAMPTEYLLPLAAVGFGDGATAKPKRASQQKTKYSCPGCEANIWGKAGLNVLCGDCENDEGSPLAFVAD